MTDTAEILATTREQAHEAARSLYAHAQCLLADGKRVRMVCGEFEDDRSLAQNRWYWGVLLRDISEQARIGGVRYTVDAWHELGKRQFLGFEVHKVAVAGRKRPTIIRRLRSTADLSVRAMAKYLDEFTAFAVADLGVTVSEPLAPAPAPVRKRAPEREAVAA